MSKIRYRCAGPVIGTWSQAEAEAAGRPRLAGTRKRGIRTRKQRGLGPDSAYDAPVRCRQDLTALVQALPADGQDHQITCPKCGNVARVMRAKTAEAAAG